MLVITLALREECEGNAFGLFVCVLFCPFVGLSICVLVCPLFVCWSVRLLVCPFVGLSVCWSVRLFVGLSVRMFVGLSVCVLVCPRAKLKNYCAD